MSLLFSKPTSSAKRRHQPVALTNRAAASHAFNRGSTKTDGEGRVDKSDCVTEEDGDCLFCWGWNGAFACGAAGREAVTSEGECDAAEETIPVPIRVYAMGVRDDAEVFRAEGIKQVSAGPFHTAVLTNSGTVFGFGDGSSGQLGQIELHAKNSKQVCSVPHIIPGLNHIAVKSISCGAYHTAILDENGSLWTFGSNEKGQLGLGTLPLDATEKSVREPQKVRVTPQILQCCCGFNFTLILDDQGVASSFGDGSSGQLGHGYDTRENKPRSSSSPEQISALRHAKIAKIAAGDAHSCFLSVDGRVFTCGKHTFGRLGLGEADSKVEEFSNPKASVPRRVHWKDYGHEENKFMVSLDQNSNGDISCDETSNSLQDAIDVAGCIFAGAASTFVILSSGAVLAWGSNSFGSLGLNHYDDVYTPTLVKAFAEIDMRAISIGSDHCCFLSWTGNVYVTGCPRRGRLGLSRDLICHALNISSDLSRGSYEACLNTGLSKPYLLEHFPTLGLTVDQICVGGAHSFAVSLGNVSSSSSSMQKVQQLRGVPLARCCVAFGDGIAALGCQEGAVHGPVKTQTWQEFYIQTRDIFGKNCISGGADLVVTITESDLPKTALPVTASLSSLDSTIEGWAQTESSTNDSRNQSIQIKVCDVKNGRYHVLYRANMRGRLLIVCSMDGESIHNSPFKVQLENSKIDPPFVSKFEDLPSMTASGEGLVRAVAGIPAVFHVTTQHCLRGLSFSRPPFEVNLKPIDTRGCPAPSTSELRVKVVEKEPTDGSAEISWKCSYNVKTAGSYLLLISATSSSNESSDNTPFVYNIMGNPWTTIVSPGEVNPEKCRVELLHSTMKTFSSYTCKIFCRDAFGNPVSIEPSELRVSVSGDKVKLASIESKAHERKASQRCCAITRVDGSPGEFEFKLHPVTCGTAHLLVSTLRGDRFRGTPTLITVEPADMLPPSSCSMSMPIIEEEQGILLEPGGNRSDASFGVVASSTSTYSPSGHRLITRSSIMMCFDTFKDIHGRPSRILISEFENLFEVTISSSDKKLSAQLSTHTSLAVKPGEACLSQESAKGAHTNDKPLTCIQVRATLQVEFLLSNDGYWQHIMLTTPLRLTVKLQGHIVRKNIPISILTSKASWWWHTKRILPAAVSIPNEFVFSSPFSRSNFVRLDAESDVNINNAVETGCRMLEQLDLRLKPSPTNWRLIARFLQAWLSSLNLFLAEPQKAKDDTQSELPSYSKSLMSFSQWLRKACGSSDKENVASWGHLLLFKLIVDRSGLFKCSLDSAGVCTCTDMNSVMPIERELENDGILRPPLLITWNQVKSSGRQSCCLDMFLEELMA